MEMGWETSERRELSHFRFKEGTALLKNLLKVSEIFLSSDIIFLFSTNVILDEWEDLSLIKGVIVFQNNLLSVIHLVSKFEKYFLRSFL